MILIASLLFCLFFRRCYGTGISIAVSVIISVVAVIISAVVIWIIIAVIIGYTILTKGVNNAV